MTDAATLASDATTATDAPPLLIGGRPFRLVGEADGHHDIYMTGRLKRAGLLKPGQFIDPDASSDENAAALVVAVYESGLTWELYGGLLVPDGVRWTPEVAQATADFLVTVSDAPSKRILRGVLAGMLPDFFLAALASPRTSPSYGNPSPTAASGSSAASPPAPPTAPMRRGPSISGAAATTASGATSS